MADHRETAQDLNQVLHAKLSGSTSAVGELGETDLTTFHRGIPPISCDKLYHHLPYPRAAAPVTIGARGLAVFYTLCLSDNPCHGRVAEQRWTNFRE